MTEVTCGTIHVPGGVRDGTGSVGKLDPNCECKLLDDDGKEVGLNLEASASVVPTFALATGATMSRPEKQLTRQDGSKQAT
ncbi:hypothetical protein CTRI78_v009140 [Colletotrichum trifolii]|uniref:Uncharacterized protein n=1 Tax=Colletotrichum trifolii TaxID=5466 RepID=A0A4R8QYF9_COLTR|nr:hypothetical protein CTRI78_v009140 [Colletotrichum trifolii]